MQQFDLHTFNLVDVNLYLLLGMIQILRVSTNESNIFFNVKIVMRLERSGMAW